MKKRFACMLTALQICAATLPAMALVPPLQLTAEQIRQEADTAKMDIFVNALMSKMTLEEKIGQLNLLSIGADVTGPILSQGVEEKIAKGLVGGCF